LAPVLLFIVYLEPIQKQRLKWSENKEKVLLSISLSIEQLVLTL
jgi:hypothetical protein